MENDLQLTMMYENINWSNNFDEISTIVSIDQTEYDQLLKRVIGEEISFSYVHYTDQMIHEEACKNYYAEYIKNNIDCGKPVIVSIINRNVLTGEYINSSCHSAVAYYYDEDGIHLNYGYVNPGSSDRILGEVANSNEETLVMMAGAIDVSNYRHSHSNNYMIDDVYNCPCGEKFISEITSEFEISNNYINDFTRYFDKKSKAYYKLNVNNNVYTEFKFLASSTIDVKIYDCDLNVIMKTESSKEIILLNTGTYYLKVSYDRKVNMGNINIVIRTKNSNELSYGSNDILMNNYNNNSNNYSYEHTNSTGFYLIEVEAINKNFEQYPTGALSIYSDVNYQNLIYKHYQSDELGKARSTYGTNSIMVYLEKNCAYYIKVDLPYYEYSSLNLKISKLNAIEDSVFRYENVANASSRVVLNNSAKNDYGVNVIFKENVTKILYISYIGNQNENIYFNIYKKQNNTIENRIELIKIESLLLNANNKTITIIDSFEGEYILTYFGLKEGVVSVSRQNFVDNSIDSIENALVTDPVSGYLVGSQISLYEKDLQNEEKTFNGKSIVKGFTRIIYFDSSYTDDTSRLLYNWYSSDENILEVSQYGTVLAKNIGTVRVLAVNKENPSIIYVINLSVIEDSKTEIVEIDVYGTWNLSDDSTYKIDLSSKNVPYPYNKYYLWNIISKPNGAEVNVNYWGIITSNATGEIICEGTYELNQRYKVKLHILII